MSKTKKYSDGQTTLFELKTIVRQFCEQRDWGKYHNPKDLSIALSIEASELLEIFRWKSSEEIKLIFENKNKILDIENEIADILYFILRFADLYNIDLSSSLQNKLLINEQRYPVNKFKGSNKKYTEID